MNLHETLEVEKQNYYAKKADIQAQRAALNLEERRLDEAMARLVEVVMDHSIHSPIPEPRPSITE